MDSQFGDAIRNYRRAANISQRQLAQRIGVDFSYISKIENGKLPPPAADTIVDICKVLNIPSEELLALTGKLPTNIQENVSTRKAAQTFLREAQKMNLSDEEWDQITHSLKKLRDE